jgi:hypothetical protein
MEVPQSSASVRKQRTQEDVSQPRPQQQGVSEVAELKQMMLGMMATMKQFTESNKADLAAVKESQEWSRAELAASQESVSVELAAVRASQENLRADLRSVRADLATSQENVRIELSQIRKDIKLESESLIKRFEKQN